MIRDAYRRYLEPVNPQESETLLIPEYNNVRPHCAHKYHTPAQVYFGQTVDIEKIKKQYEEAKKNRILEKHLLLRHLEIDWKTFLFCLQN
jgi:hypothetical protein